MHPSNFLPKYVAAAVIICSGLLLWLSVHNGHSWDGDAFGFMQQAQAILSGTMQEYMAANSFITSGGTWRGGPVAYPWGFPLLLATAQFFAGDSLLTYKFVGMLSWICFLVALWWAFHRELSTAQMAFLLALFAFHPWFLFNASNEVMSDIPGLLSAFVTLVSARRILTEKKYVCGPRCDRILLGVLLLLSIVIRTTNIFVLGATLLTQGTQILRTRLSHGEQRNFWQQVLLESLPFITFLVGYFAWLRIFPGGGTGYAEQFLGDSGYILNPLHGDFWHALLRVNIDNIITINEFFPTHEKSLLSFFLLFCVTITAFYGIKKTWGKNLVFIFFIALYSFFFSLTGPIYQGLRYYIPILPLVFYFSIIGISSAVKQKRKRATLFLICIGWLIISIFFVKSTIYILKNIEKNGHYDTGPYAEDAQELFSFILNKTKKDDVIIFFRPRIVYAMTQRKSLPFSIDLQGDYVCRTNNNISVRGEPSEKYFIPLEKRHSIERIFSNQSFSCYEILNTKDSLNFIPYNTKN